MGHICHVVLASIGHGILNAVGIREYVCGSKNSLCWAVKPFPEVLFIYFSFSFFSIPLWTVGWLVCNHSFSVQSRRNVRHIRICVQGDACIQYEYISFDVQRWSIKACNVISYLSLCAQHSDQQTYWPVIDMAYAWEWLNENRAIHRPGAHWSTRLIPLSGFWAYLLSIWRAI